MGGETVDTPALGAGAARHGGSSPLPRTEIKTPIRGFNFAWEETVLVHCFVRT